MPNGSRNEPASLQHVSVLRQEVLDMLVPAERTPKRILDCTLGLAGHAQALLKLAGTDAQLVGMDADEVSRKSAPKEIRLSAFSM